MRKIISLLLAIAMVLSMATVAFAAEATFTDLEEGQYYVPAVEWAVEHEITTGVSATEFAPHATCTRGQVVTFLYRAAGEPEVAEGTKNPFTDVAEGAYYYNAVLWAVAEGVTTGATETTFNPDGECKREHVVTFQYRASGEPEVASAAAFTDVAKDAYYAPAVAWAVEEGITTGATETTFNPEGACERAHVVTFLYRSFLPGAVNNPIVATELSSIEVAAGAKVYYGIHGRLSGQILTIVADEDEDVTVYVEGEAVEAVDGVFAAELTGAPTTSVVVVNNGEKDADLVVEINYAVGTENNPIVIKRAEELTSVAAAAEGETYYQISSDLNRYILNITEAEGLTVTLNDEELVPVDGVLSAELTGTPVNKLVVANDGKKAVETPAVIVAPEGSEENPYQINAADDMGAIYVAAGEGVYYTISKDLFGQGLMLHVEAAENLVITVDGEEAIANDEGYFVVELDGTGDSMAVVASNVGEEELEVVAYIQSAPGTEGNPIMIEPALMMFPGGSVNAFSFNLPANGTVYYFGRLAGQIMTIDNAFGMTVTVGEDEYSANMMGQIVIDFPASEMPGPAPVTYLSITNADEENECGGMMVFTEPEVESTLVWGFDETNVAEVAAFGNCEYKWTAEAAGTVTVMIDTDMCDDWCFMIDKEVNGFPSGAGEMHYSDSEEVGAYEDSISVEAGETVVIVIATASYEAGEVPFWVDFTAADAE